MSKRTASERAASEHETSGVAARAASASTPARVLSVVASVLLALTLVACGFAACLPPQVTIALSEATSADALSPFTLDELIYAADETRDYTVGSHDAEALYDMMWSINLAAASDGRSSKAGPAVNATDATERPSVAELEETFARASDVYVLDAEAISHLDDVYAVVSKAYPTLIAIGVLAIACLALTWRFCGRRAFAQALVGAGSGVLICFLVFGAWAIVDFNSLFAVFHSLFFAEGTWTFPYDSLLICMYPLNFWISMGAIWLATSSILSLVAIIVGTVIKRKSRIA